jgi:hypothetical protein
MSLFLIPGILVTGNMQWVTSNRTTVILCLDFLLAGSDQAFYSLSSSLGRCKKKKTLGGQTPMVHTVARQDSRVRENAQVTDGDDGGLVLEQLLGGLRGEMGIPNEFRTTGV